MKKWENPELTILGVEETEVEIFGQGPGLGNGETPSDCFCHEVGNGHNHGADGWKDRCKCCQRDSKPDNPLPNPS